jgi:hypothetical protein
MDSKKEKKRMERTRRWRNEQMEETKNENIERIEGRKAEMMYNEKEVEKKGRKQKMR